MTRRIQSSEDWRKGCSRQRAWLLLTILSITSINNTKVLRKNRFDMLGERNFVLMKCGECGVWYKMGLRKKAGLGIMMLWLE